MAKHTPGPWKQDTSRHEASRERLVVLGGDGKPVADCETRCEDGKEFLRTFHEDAANARLVAASPDMLKACEAVGIFVDLEHLQAVYEGRCRLSGDALRDISSVVSLACAAVAKAEGGSDA